MLDMSKIAFPIFGEKVDHELCKNIFESDNDITKDKEFPSFVKMLALPLREDYIEQIKEFLICSEKIKKIYSENAYDKFILDYFSTSNDPKRNISLYKYYILKRKYFSNYEYSLKIIQGDHLQLLLDALETKSYSEQLLLAEKNFLYEMDNNINSIEAAIKKENFYCNTFPKLNIIIMCGFAEINALLINLKIESILYRDRVKSGINMIINEFMKFS